MTTGECRHNDKTTAWMCLLLALCMSSSCAAAELSSSDVNANDGQATGEPGKSDDRLVYLDLANRSITQRVEPGDAPNARFVQVQVMEVTNRKRIPLSFEVRYQAKDGTKIYLGSFALYPPDNPGKFIVATQGKVKSDGAIVLTLVISEKIDPEDVVKVGIKRIRLVQA